MITFYDESVGWNVDLDPNDIETIEIVDNHMHIVNTDGIIFATKEIKRKAEQNKQSMKFDVKEPFAPFLKHIGEDKVDSFMFMGATQQEDKLIYFYKHEDTRRYIRIDIEGNFYTWTGGNEQYTLISKEIAWAHVTPNKN